MSPPEPETPVSLAAPPAAAASAGDAPDITRGELFKGFMEAGMFGFGGVIGVAHHVIVERRRWLSDQEFAAVIGIGQVLPGPNILNAAVIIGDRFQGPTGAVAAVAGLMAMPLVILIVLASVYLHFAARADVQAAIGGAASAAAGIVLGTAFKMARRLKPTAVSILFGLVAFTAVGIARLPLVPTLAVLVPASVAVALAGRRR